MRQDIGIWSLLAVFGVTAAYFSVRVPAFETPDEFQHYAYVQHVVTWYDLPQSEPNTPGLWRQQGVQAPLYYIGGALLTFRIDQSALPATAHRVNRFARLGQLDAPDNRNFFLPHADDGWPWQKEFLALHVLRLYSVLLGCATLYAVYRFLRLLLNRRSALLSAAVCAFIPQFVFIAGAASNDNLVTAAASFFIWRLAVLTQAAQEPSGATESRNGNLKRQAWRLGFVLAIALLAKLSALGLLGLAGAAVAWTAWRAQSPALLWRLGWRLAAPALALAGWWYARNLWLYGDVLAWNIWEANITLRTAPLRLQSLARELPGMFQSFWGAFGWLTVPYPPRVYAAFGWLTAALALLFGYWGVRAARNVNPEAYLFENVRFMQSLWAFAWLAILVVSWLRFMLVAPAAQGRYLFPALTALALGVGLGISVLPRRAQQAAWIAPVGLWLLSAATPSWIIAPAYVPPASDQHAEAVLEPWTAETGLDWAQPEFRLAGVGLAQAYRPGQTHPVFLRLQALNPVREDYALFVHFRDEADAVVAQYDGLPGGGLWPTSQWPVGETRTERFDFFMPPDVPPGTRGRIVMGLYHPWTWQRTLWPGSAETEGSEMPNELAIGSFAIVDAE